MQVENHVFWVAESCLKGCVGQGETSEDAINELAENETIWLETATECGIPIPERSLENPVDYSGKFTVRVSPSVHRNAVERAREEKISLNQYVNDAIVEKNTRMEVAQYISSEVLAATTTIKRLITETSQTHSSGQGKQTMTVTSFFDNIIGGTSSSGTTLSDICFIS